MGPKIALVPFLEKTKHFDAETQRAVGRRMVVTAVVTGLVLFASGALLMRLLHITGGAVAVAGGIILAILAIEMVTGQGKKAVEEIGVPEDPNLAVYPLAVPYLLNPVGITILIISSAKWSRSPAPRSSLGWRCRSAPSIIGSFADIDKLSKRLNPTGLVISEVVFGILLTAVAVQFGGQRTRHARYSSRWPLALRTNSRH